MTLRRTLLLLALVAPHAGLSAQAPASSATPPVVAADAGAVNGALVAPGTYRRALVMVQNGKERQLGVITETISVTGTGPDATLLRAQMMTVGPTTVTDTAVSRAATLAPMWHASHQPAVTMALQFAGRRVTGTHTTGSKPPVVIDTELSDAVFDSNNHELVMGALPLAAGYSARLPTYIYEKKGNVWCDLRVTGEETLDGTPAWVLEVAYAGSRTRYWYAKEGRVVLRSETVLPGGAVMRTVLEK